MVFGDVLLLVCSPWAGAFAVMPVKYHGQANKTHTAGGCQENCYYLCMQEDRRSPEETACQRVHHNINTCVFILQLIYTLHTAYIVYICRVQCIVDLESMIMQSSVKQEMHGELYILVRKYILCKHVVHALWCVILWMFHDSPCCRPNSCIKHETHQLCSKWAPGTRNQVPWGVRHEFWPNELDCFFCPKKSAASSSTLVDDVWWFCDESLMMFRRLQFFIKTKLRKNSGSWPQIRIVITAVASSDAWLQITIFQCKDHLSIHSRPGE